MSPQITNNNYMTTSTSPNPYITRKFNNMNEGKIFKKKHDNWTKLYYKTLKGLEAMINVQKQVWDMIKMAKETNTIITEMEGMILKASINNRMMNTTNLLGISEDLRDLIQSNIKD